MNSNDTRGGRRDGRHGRGGRRPSYRNNNQRRDERGDRQEREPRAAREEAPKKLSFWGRILAFFTGGSKKLSSSPGRSSQRDSRSGEPRPAAEARKSPRPGPPAPVEVTTPKLYIGNLSYDATESDLFDLFKGVGQVQNAEIVTQKGTYRSKGFGFVTMLTVDEAKRAVQELHDKEFMGRKLVVNGSKSEGPRE